MSDISVGSEIRLHRAPSGGDLSSGDISAIDSPHAGPGSEIRSLVQRCLRRDQQAMTELVERYRDRVYGLCFRMLGQRQDAEDTMQETFTRVFRSLHRWDSTRPFEPWLLAIAGNRCRTMISTRQRRPTVQTLVEQPSDDSELQRSAALLSEEVQRALQDLKPDHRQAFILFHEQELSYLEIADAMSVPLGTIKTWVHRARKQIIGTLASRQVIEETPSAVRNV